MGLIKITMSLDAGTNAMENRSLTLFEYWKKNQIYHFVWNFFSLKIHQITTLHNFVFQDEYSDQAVQWNQLRDEALKICIDTLQTHFARETKAKLVQEAKRYILMVPHFCLLFIL